MDSDSSHSTAPGFKAARLCAGLSVIFLFLPCIFAILPLPVPAIILFVAWPLSFLLALSAILLTTRARRLAQTSPGQYDVPGLACVVISASLVLIYCATIALAWQPTLRRAVVQRIANPALLEAVAFRDSDELVREGAVLELVDQGRLSKIASEHQVPEVRLTAISRLTDAAALEKIISNEKEVLLLRQFANQRFEAITGTRKFSFH